MSTSYFLVLCSLLPILVQSCSTYNFSCGNFTLEIQYPFFSDEHPAGCSSSGLHHIQCLNLVPVIRLHSEGFYFPVWNISYSDKSLVVHDLKLSSYFRGSNCVFLYNLTSPVLQVNVSNVSEYLSSSQGFFNCETSEDGFSRDVFKELYNLSRCTNYSLYYSNSLGDQTGGHCKNSSGIWFEWRLAFDEDDGNVSLLSAGFSPNWTPFPDCFSCQFVAGNCSNQCRGVTPSKQTQSRYC